METPQDRPLLDSIDKFVMEFSGLTGVAVEAIGKHETMLLTAEPAYLAIGTGTVAMLKLGDLNRSARYAALVYASYVAGQYAVALARHITG